MNIDERIALAKEMIAKREDIASDFASQEIEAEIAGGAYQA
jgi:hypothetical protein